MTLSNAYFIDFDGTITVNDLSSELAAYYGGQAHREIENKYRRREIPIREWLRANAKILPADMELLHSKALEWAVIRPGFESFLEYARDQKNPVVIASDGFGFYIEPILEKHGLLDQVSHIYRNETFVDQNGNLVVNHPHSHPVCSVCGNCKAAHVIKVKSEKRPVLYIGDGSNDRFGASWSDHVCARDKLVESCREFKIKYSPWNDFYDIMRIDKPGLKNCADHSLCFPQGNGIKL